ncbi:TetR/AcrR family transcriptional regulator [Photobacterium lipolyticum]|uniref:TetR family transcriptional regulator n=1 Tax=Photobacterium lipolyticum TaxID=266810 RepID=A0A2T3MWM3_9GAMM|nr:TetR/AcrR family transcriptional regulator [Photobacterium lipolyticum]PSW04385.1 TetR family transcriptional regulator [Photobacterium lipolyticum]
MNTQTKATRQHILDTGYDLIVAKGFSNVGLSQLLQHAEVPKGSFYHYFKSKEQFGEALINDYFANYLERLNGLFNSEAGSAYDRLISYWQRWIDVQKGVCGAQKCLVVKLSAEVSDLSDPMRLALLKGATSIISSISQCIEDGNQDGSIKVENSQQTAQLLYNLWLGASLMSKLSQDQMGLVQAMKTTKQILAGDTES